jgi:hypothetical protein
MLDVNAGAAAAGLAGVMRGVADSASLAIGRVLDTLGLDR